MRWFGRRKRRDEWTLATEIGEGWYPLALDMDPDEFEATVAQALRDGAPEALGRALTDAEAGDLAAEVAEWSRFVHEEPGVIEAAVLRSTFDGPVEALLTTSLASPSPDLSLQECVSVLLDGEEAEVTEEQLQVGPALRVHRTGAPDPDDPEGTVPESVAYAFRTPDGDVVWHEMSWEGLGDHRLCSTADAIAAGLSFS